MSRDHDESRRKLLVVGAAAAAALPVGAGIAAPLVGREEALEDDFVDVGEAESFRPGAPRRVRLQGDVTDAWKKHRNVALGNAFVLRDESGAFTVFSSACPHLGCAVDWREERFECPCHEGVFAADGAVLSGPAPRGLDRLESRVIEGRLQVRKRPVRA